jgi:hypothetical protein
MDPWTSSLWTSHHAKFHTSLISLIKKEKRWVRWRWRIWDTKIKAMYVLGGQKELVLFQALYPVKICDTSSTKDISKCNWYVSVLILPDLYFLLQHAYSLLATCTYTVTQCTNICRDFCFPKYFTAVCWALFSHCTFLSSVYLIFQAFYFKTHEILPWQ